MNKRIRDKQKFFRKSQFLLQNGRTYRYKTSGTPLVALFGKNVQKTVYLIARDLLLVRSVGQTVFLFRITLI